MFSLFKDVPSPLSNEEKQALKGLSPDHQNLILELSKRISQEELAALKKIIKEKRVEEELPKLKEKLKLINADILMKKMIEKKKHLDDEVIGLREHHYLKGRNFAYNIIVFCFSSYRESQINLKTEKHSFLTTLIDHLSDESSIVLSEMSPAALDGKTAQLYQISIQYLTHRRPEKKVEKENDEKEEAVKSLDSPSMTDELEKQFAAMDKEIQEIDKDIEEADKLEKKSDKDAEIDIDKEIDMGEEEETIFSMTEYEVQLENEISELEEKGYVSGKNFLYNAAVYIFPSYRMSEIKLKQEKAEFLDQVIACAKVKKSIDIDQVKGSIFDGHTLTLFSRALKICEPKESERVQTLLKIAGLR